jgi:anthranilate phosphoribosyltransferase/anthranilate synthase/phosphoribosyltransferase
MAETLAALGHESAWIVHGMGLDELTVAGQNHVTALHAGKITSFVVEPEEAGLSRSPIAAIQGGDAGFNAAALENMLQGAPGAYHDTVLLNAAAALIVAGQVAGLREGVSRATHSIVSGAAFAALQTLRRVSAVPVP